MSVERRQQADELFHEALVRGPAERDAFLAEACGSDEGLLKEVKSLLAYRERAEGFLEEPVAEAAARLLTGEPERPAAGQRLGHYRIVRLLGEGGMGEAKIAMQVLPRLAWTCGIARRL